VEASSHCPCFQKGQSSSVRNYRPIPILNDFSRVFEFIIHDHICLFFFKSKLNSCQHGFIKSKSTITNFVTFLDFVTPLVRSQGQVDSIYFAFSNAFGILPHALLLHKLKNSGYINWCHSYLTDSRVYVFQAYFLLHVLFCLVYLRAQF
jgi:hypothetical protein